MPDIGGLLKMIQKAATLVMIIPLVLLAAKQGFQAYVVDSNVFMTNLNPAELALKTVFLANPMHLLIVPAAVYRETLTDPGAQLLLRRPGIIPVPDPPLTPAELTALNASQTGKFNWEDARILETAKILNVPLVTFNLSLQNQVLSDPVRCAQWCSVRQMPPFP
jgi:hypothetical protein